MKDNKASQTKDGHSTLLTKITKNDPFVNPQHLCIKNYLLPAFTGNIFAAGK
jgi:hypothetical protein